MSNGGTVHPASKFNANQDAEALEKAMKGAGTDEKAIIELLAARSVYQRQQIEETYKASYGKDLRKRLHSELSGKFRRSVLYSFYDMAHVQAKALYLAMKGAGTDELVLISIICPSTNAEIAALKQAYNDILVEEKQNPLRRNLESDIKDDLSGDFERVIVALLQGKREESCDDRDVATECENLYKGGEAKLGTDESTFTRVLCTKSFETIRKINEAYEKSVGHDLTKAIEKETSGDYRTALKTIVRAAMNREACNAVILYKSMKGAGTHDENLIQMIMAHSEVDLALIMRYFDSAFDEPLAKMVKGDTSGDYRRFLLAILGVSDA